MVTRLKRRTAEARVLVVATESTFLLLQARLDDVQLTRADPEDATDLALAVASRPHVCAWLGADPVAGLRVLRTLVQARLRARSLFVTPRSAVSERLAALEANVDDVITEPVARSEVAARIRILIRRAQPLRDGRLVIAAGLELDVDRLELLRDGSRVHLRPKEARLLEFFALRPGSALSRDHILERVWGPHHAGDPRTVDVHVRWLRAKIEPDPHAPVRLLTVRGVGYRLEPDPLTER